jgi:nucleoid-associated protein YgaU
MFDPSSRYHALANAEYVTPDGERLTYRKRRFLPQPAPHSTDRVAVVRAGERLDAIAARTLGDPLQYWRIADAGNAMNPFDLLEPGRLLDVPMIALRGTRSS